MGLNPKKCSYPLKPPKSAQTLKKRSGMAESVSNQGFARKKCYNGISRLSCFFGLAGCSSIDSSVFLPELDGQICGAVRFRGPGNSQGGMKTAWTISTQMFGLENPASGTSGTCCFRSTGPVFSVPGVLADLLQLATQPLRIAGWIPSPSDLSIFDRSAACPRQQQLRRVGAATLRTKPLSLASLAEESLEHLNRKSRLSETGAIWGIPLKMIEDGKP